VVAGPVAALNFQGMKAQPRRAAVFALRATCLAFLLALIALAVPGWLQGFHQKARQVAWDVEADPSLRRAAENLRVWRARGHLRPDERTFPFHPDVACYCAWFCPGEKSFIDSRFSLFGQTGDKYTAICRELDPSLDAREPIRVSPPVTATAFEAQHVALVVLYDPDPKRLLSVASGLYRSPEEWTLLAVDGQAVIFGWNAARAKTNGDSFAALRFDPRRAAFGASADDEERTSAAPGQGPGRDPREPDWRTHFGKPPEAAWESVAASVYLRLFEDKEEARRRETVDRYYTTAAAGFGGLPATVDAPDGPLGPATAVAFRLGALDETLAEINDKPPELPLLAVRAARRAAAANPDDANAYLRLAQAYLVLRNETVEHSHGAALSPLVMLRHVQIVTALRQALILNPDLEAAHQHLAMLLAERQYYDAALDHRRAELRISRGAGRRAGEDADAFTRRLDEMARRVQEMEKQVQDAQDRYVIDSQPLSDDPPGQGRTGAALRPGAAGSGRRPIAVACGAVRFSRRAAGTGAVAHARAGRRGAGHVNRRRHEGQ
jgi:tetratricopeptide (TPR) repeat protein